MPNADKLKGCPFLACKGHKTGSKPRFCSTPDHYITSEKAFWVECSYCGVHSPSGETREEAAEHWNTRTDTRPAPRVGDDVVEAMAKAHHESFYTHLPKFDPPNTWEGLSDERKAEEIEDMQATLTAAEAMGYVFTKHDRVLVKP